MPFLNLRSAVRKQATHLLRVAVSNLQGLAQLSFALRTFLRENMTEVGLGPLKAALSRPAEALGGAPVGLHLGHFVSIY